MKNNQRKGALNRRLRLLCTLYIEVSRKLCLHFTLIFKLRYYKMLQSLYKSCRLLVSKVTGVWTTSDKLFFKKYIPSAKKLYTEDLSDITFN